MKQVFVILIAALVLVPSIGHAQKKKKKKKSKNKVENAKGFDAGTYKEGTYKNNFFDFSITIDETWSVQSQESWEDMVESGLQIMDGDKKTMDKLLDISKITTLNLLTAMQHPYGAPVDFNPSILIIAENISTTPGIATGKDYQWHAQRALSVAMPSAELGPLNEIDLNGVIFGVMDITSETMGIEVKQQYWSIVRDGFALSFVITYNDEDQYLLLKAMLNTLAFGNN